MLEPWLKIVGLLYIRYLWDPESSTPNLVSYPPSVCLSIAISSFGSILRANASAGITKVFCGRCAERLWVTAHRRCYCATGVAQLVCCPLHGSGASLAACAAEYSHPSSRAALAFPLALSGQSCYRPSGMAVTPW